MERMERMEKMLSQRSISCDSCSDRIDEIDQNAFDIICSVPGKVILHGEHAVVYGKSAVAVSVDLRTTVEIKLGGNDVQIKLADLNADQIWPFSSFERIRLVNDVDEKSPKNFELTETLLDKIKPFIDDMHFDAFYPYGHNHHDPKKKSEEEESKFSITQINNSLKAFLLLYLGISDVYRSSQHVPLRIIVTSTLPCGAGLGSSSAFSVSLTAALFKAYNVKASDEIISDWAYQIDKLFHGKPSGIDNSICTFGGALLFRNGKIEKQLTNIPQFEVILVNTKVARNTKSLVQKAKDQYDKYPLVYDNILAAIDEVSKSAWSLFEDKNDNSKNIGKFKELFQINQLLLSTLNIGHPSIDKIISIASQYNFGAKLTGAGGGGCVIILVDSSKTKISVENLINELEESGFECWRVGVGCPGITFV